MKVEVQTEADLCRDRIISEPDFIRSDGTATNFGAKTDVVTNDASVTNEPTNVKLISVASTNVGGEDFQLSTNNLSLIRSGQKEQATSVKDEVEVKVESSMERESSIKSEVKAEPVDPKPSLTNGNKSSSSDIKKRHRHDSGERSSSGKRRERDRSRDRDRHRPKRANIGIQCRRDKNLEKTVGFGTPLPSTTMTSATNTTTATMTTTISASSSEPAPEVRMASGFVNSPRYAGYSMANPCYNLCSKYKYGHLMRVEVYPNGGGKVLHLWQDEYAHFTEQEADELAREFIKVELHLILYVFAFCSVSEFRMTWVDYLFNI